MLIFETEITELIWFPSGCSIWTTQLILRQSYVILGNKLMLCTRFQVIYEGTKSYYPDFKHTNSVQTVALSWEVTDLYPDTKYNFVVVATKYCRDGDNRTMVTIRTVIDGKLWIDHFTVVCLGVWPLNESEAGGEIVLIETSLLFSC